MTCYGIFLNLFHLKRLLRYVATKDGMEQMKPIARRDIIIDSIVSAYLETGEPVSSSYIAGICGIGISPATVRNDMKELERDGYLMRPHSSAGCIPTVKSYRYYVGHLMQPVDLEKEDFSLINRMIEQVFREKDAELFMDHVAVVISEVTDLVGVTMSPLYEQCVFERLEIVNLGGARYLLVISLKSGLVKTINFTASKVIARTKVEETARLLTQRLSGLTIREIKTVIANRKTGIAGGDHHMIDVILERWDSLFPVYNDQLVHLAGFSRLLSQYEKKPELYSRKLVDLVEHRSDLASVMMDMLTTNKDFDIVIGGGLLGPNPPLSLVTAVYYTEDDAPGVIGVIGPARVPYSKLLAIVKHTASAASQLYPG